MTDSSIQAQADAIEAEAETLEEQSAGSNQLSFSFAKRNQVLLDTEQTPAKLYFTEETPVAVFAEVRRFLGAPFVPKPFRWTILKRFSLMLSSEIVQPQNS